MASDFYYQEDIIPVLCNPQVAANRAFVFLWCGSSDGLDLGRLCLQTWGFRRCEDICWIQTNAKSPGIKKVVEQNSVFQRTKGENCKFLLGPLFIEKTNLCPHLTYR